MACLKLGQKGLLLAGLLALALLGGCVQQTKTTKNNNGGTPTVPTSPTAAPGDSPLPTSVTGREQSTSGFSRTPEADVFGGEPVVRGVLDDGDAVL